MKKKLVVFTGAGISKESGIDTFRDAVDGLWYNFNVEEVAHIDGWRKDKQKVLDFYNMRRRQLNEVEPNAAHYGLVELEKEYDVTVVTQNVDDLHERAGSSKVIHLHGELTKACSSNNKALTVSYDKDIAIGDKHPDGSQLRPFIVWFGESVPNMDLAYNIAYSADVLVVIGTSLNVYPAADIIYATKEDTPIIVINPDPNTTDCLNTVIREPATVGVAKLNDVLKTVLK